MICPHCHGTGEAPSTEAQDAAPLADILALRGNCKALGYAITHDDLVPEKYAAALLKRGRSTLRRWRDEGCPYGSLRHVERLGQIFYRLADLAVLMNKSAAVCSKRLDAITSA